MEKLRSFVDRKENPLAISGPLFLVVALALLWGLSKEVSVILPAAGLVGLAFTWMGRSTGLWVAQTLILLTLIFSLWTNPLDYYWQMVFALSMSISLFITSLTQRDVVEYATSAEKLLAEKTAELTATLSVVSALQETLINKEAYLTIARDEFLHMQRQHREWSDAVFEEKRKVARVEELLEEQIIEIVDSPEYRRLNGAYTQLKEQFKEKDSVLIETRKELFHTQEQANSLAKELDEFKLYGVPSEIAQLQQHCAQIEQNYQSEAARLRAEIQALESVVEQWKS